MKGKRKIVEIKGERKEKGAAIVGERHTYSLTALKAEGPDS